jgi:hypothetical protein
MRSAAALLVALSTLTGAAPSLAGEKKAEPATGAIQLAFKLDPRLSGATYGGERWVSPPIYQGSSGQSTVEAKASVMDASGRPTKASIDWKSSDPEMVTVSPAAGEKVTITVKRAGESSLTLTSGAVSRKLGVKALDRNGARQVTISQ